MKNRYKIAGSVAEINSLYPDVHKYCAEYQTSEFADYTVTVTQSDIDAEREYSLRESQIEGISAPEYPDSYLEKLAVLRKMSDELISRNTLLFHVSAVSLDGDGYLFTAKSGTGKSTHTRLWREYFGDRAVIVNDDKPFLQISDEGVIVFGSPYGGNSAIRSRKSRTADIRQSVFRFFSGRRDRAGQYAAAKRRYSFANRRYNVSGL